MPSALPLRLHRVPRMAVCCALKRALMQALGVLAVVGSAPLLAQPAGPVTVAAEVAAQFALVAADPRVQTSLQEIAAAEPETLAEQVRITEIPAPPFQEQRRAEYYLEQMRQRGLTDAYIDTEGNVIGVRPGTGDGPLFVIAAHLDTVFPLETDVSVEMRDGRYYAPGISDDGRGLTALLTLIDAITRHADCTDEGLAAMDRHAARKDLYAIGQ